MGKLKAKLGRLQAGRGFGAPKPVPEPAPTTTKPKKDRTAAEASRLERVRAALQELQQRRPPVATAVKAGVQAGLPGEEWVSDWGPVYRVVGNHGNEHTHGGAALGACMRARGDHAALLALDEELAQLDMTRLLFMDTETTGLAGGTGVVPFLVGMTWYDAAQGSWRTEQLLLRQPGDEEPMLRYFQARLETASGLVTFNGKCFDWPLLKTRFVLNRLPAPPVLPHIDLLHCTRRMLRRHPGPLRLVNLEQDLMGFHRQGDIDGAAIPATYFAFLRGAPAHVLTPIVVHNAHDLLAMVALLGILVARLEDPTALDAAACLSMAELRLRAGQADGAASLAAVAAAEARGGTAVDAHLLMARLAKRQGQHQQAATALLAALAVEEQGGARQALAHLGLAKLFEHRLGDLPRALHHARLATPAEGFEASARRLARLLRKSASAANSALDPRPAE